MIFFFFQRKLRMVELQNSMSFFHTCIFPIDEIAKMKLRKILSYWNRKKLHNYYKQVALEFLILC